MHLQAGLFGRAAGKDGQDHGALPLRHGAQVHPNPHVIHIAGIRSVLSRGVFRADIS